VTATFVPRVAALEAHLCSALTHSLVIAAARFSYYVLATWSGAPLQVFVFAYNYVLLYPVVHYNVFFCAKGLNLVLIKSFATFLVHATDIKNFAILNTHCKVVSHTGLTKLMPTAKRKEICLSSKLFEADLTRLWHKQEWLRFFYL
jgi:hypothetical protein